MMRTSKSVRKAVGLGGNEEPLFWPSGKDLSNPDLLCYIASAELWVKLSNGDATGSIWILYGDPQDGFEWQNTGSQFADHGCDWGRLRNAYEAKE